MARQQQPAIAQEAQDLTGKIQPQVTGQTALDKAVKYLASDWSKSALYVEGGYLPINGNRTENAIRPLHTCR